MTWFIIPSIHDPSFAIFDKDAREIVASGMSKENARLFLAALKRMVERSARWLESGDAAGPDESRSIHEQMVSAIAKAGG